MHTERSLQEGISRRHFCKSSALGICGVGLFKDHVHPECNPSETSRFEDIVREALDNHEAIRNEGDQAKLIYGLIPLVTEINPELGYELFSKSKELHRFSENLMLDEIWHRTSQKSREHFFWRWLPKADDFDFPGDLSATAYNCGAISWQEHLICLGQLNQSEYGNYRSFKMLTRTPFPDRMKEPVSWFLDTHQDWSPEFAYHISVECLHKGCPPEMVERLAKVVQMAVERGGKEILYNGQKEILYKEPPYDIYLCIFWEVVEHFCPEFVSARTLLRYVGCPHDQSDVIARHPQFEKGLRKLENLMPAAGLCSDFTLFLLMAEIEPGEATLKANKTWAYSVANTDDSELLALALKFHDYMEVLAKAGVDNLPPNASELIVTGLVVVGLNVREYMALLHKIRPSLIEEVLRNYHFEILRLEDSSTRLKHLILFNLQIGEWYRALTLFRSLSILSKDGFSDDDQGTDIGAWRFSETLSEIVEFHPEKATQVYPLFVEEWQRDLWFSKVTEAGSENPGALKAYGRPDFINQALEFAHARPAGYPRAQALTQLAQLILLFSREAKD